MCRAATSVSQISIFARSCGTLGCPKKCKPLSKAGVLQPFPGVCKPGACSGQPGHPTAPTWTLGHQNHSHFWQGFGRVCGHSGLCSLQVQKDEFMGNHWVLALLWCSSVSGEESLLWKGCFVMDHMEILMGLEREMSWGTSGPVRWSFSKERWKGWFLTWVSLSLMYLLSRTSLWLPVLALVDCSD